MPDELKMSPSITHRLTHGAQDKLQPKRLRLKPLDRDAAKESLLLLKEVMDRRGIKFWLLYGTLLGAVRDKNFIAWDNDIDLGFYFDDVEEIYKALLELRTLDFDIFRVTATSAYVQVRRNGVYIDMVLWSRQHETMWRCDEYSEPNDFFSDLVEWPFLDTTFLVPREYEEYLRMHYCGDKWRTPDPSCKRAKMFKVGRRRKAT